jgi:hypothetical protein
MPLNVSNLLHAAPSISGSLRGPSAPSALVPGSPAPLPASPGQIRGRAHSAGNQFGRQVRDAAWRVADDLAVGKPDRLVVPADPALAVVRFAEHIEQVVAGGPVA